MIKSLRKKFIIVAMCSTFAVLAAIMGVVNISNYCKIINRADQMTLLLAGNNGRFDMPPDFADESSDNPPQQDRPKADAMSPETPFSTRFFTVIMDADGNTIDSDLGKIAAVSQEEAEQYAKELFYKDSLKGFYGIYRYRITETNDEIMIIFLDCSQDLDNIKNFAVTSVAVSVLGLIAVFLLVWVSSKMVFRPVEKTYEKQKQFITDASHEIKTPLTIIDANTEVLEMENGENQWTKSTRNQIKRLSSLTQQLITLSKLDEGTDKMEQYEFSLSDAVADSVKSFDVLARTREKRLKSEIETNINFSGNEKALRQLMEILMDNAIKYSSDKSTINITLKQKGKKIYLEISNRTDNMPQGNMDILFERFYRMDLSRNSETGGSGIGLSVAKAIVLSHKGKITAYSEDGKRLKISVEFKL